MTLDEFLDEFDRLKREENLSVTMQRYGPEKVRIKYDEAIFCPLTFVAYKKLDKKLEVCDMDTAANLLEINFEDCYSIAHSADNLQKYCHFNQSIKERLLNTAFGETSHEIG